MLDSSIENKFEKKINKQEKKQGLAHINQNIYILRPVDNLVATLAPMIIRPQRDHCILTPHKFFKTLWKCTTKGITWLKTATQN